MILGHGGNIVEAAVAAGCQPSDIIDMSSNTNPLGPMPGLLEHLASRLDRITSLPQADAGLAVRAFADMHGLDPDLVLAAGGSTHFIHAIPRIAQGRRALILGPTYADYAGACSMNGMGFFHLMSGPGDAFRIDLDQAAFQARECGLVFVCNPNNPTGSLISREELTWLAKKCPDAVFVADESYLPFIGGNAEFSLGGQGLCNVIVLRSFSKIHKVPGLRIGFAEAAPSLRHALERYQLPWSVGSLAGEAVLFAARNLWESREYEARTAAFVAAQQREFTRLLEGARGVRLFPGRAPYILLRLDEGAHGPELCRAFLRERVLVRDCSNFEGLSSHYVRISFKSESINQSAARIILRFLADSRNGVA